MNMNVLINVFLIGATIFGFMDDYQKSYKVIRYMQTKDGYLVIEYDKGLLKKQIKKNQLLILDLPVIQKNEIEYEISKLNVHETIQNIEKLDQVTKNDLPTIMYLFIEGKDTLRTKIFKPSNTPVEIKKLDFLLYKKR